jgi:cell wall-associated NlpC family hydrolase
MRMGHSTSRAMAKAGIALLVVAALAGIGIGVASNTGAAATSKTAPTKTAATTPATVNAILAYAASQKGSPYCYGGGGINGPTEEISSPGNDYDCPPPTKGYDCMSLAQYAVYQGTGGKVTLPSNNTQLTQYTFISPSGGNEEGGLKPGDVVYFGNDLNSYNHSGVYAGGGEIWDAFNYGVPVGEHTFAFLMGDGTGEGDYTYLGAYRYPAKSVPLFSISTPALPSGTVYGLTHKSYSATLKTTAGTGPYKWRLASGSKALPPGLKLGSTNGVVSGEATKAGTFSFVVQVQDTATKGDPSQTAKRALAIKIT